MTTTSDLYDQYGEYLESCESPLRNYGGLRNFSGRIETLRSHEDNLLLKDILREPGEGRVLVVEAGGTHRVAMLGDNMAAIALANDWVGLIIHGAIRDVTALREIPIGVKALASNPRRSRKEGKGERGTTLQFGGALFVPGRTVVSDEDGIVVVPE